MIERSAGRTFLCGWCAGACLSTNEPRAMHRRCRSTEQLPCACAVAGHKLTDALVERMAAFNHISVEQVRAGHERPRRKAKA